MGRQAPPEPYTEKMLLSLANRLERAAARIRAIRDVMVRDGEPERLFIFNHKSMTLAIESAEAFSFEAEKSWDAYERGEPYSEATTKSELSGRNLSKSDASQGADEAEVDGKKSNKTRSASKS
jgi:hypothetical protein